MEREGFRFKMLIWRRENEKGLSGIAYQIFQFLQNPLSLQKNNSTHHDHFRSR